MIEAVVGFLTGVIASMGLGGGFVLVIWLTVFMDVGQKTAQGINLLFFLPIALLSLIIHIKGGLVDKSLIKKYMFGGIVGAVLGTLLSDLVGGELLRSLFGVFLLAFGVKELLSASVRSEDKSKQGRKS